MRHGAPVVLRCAVRNLAAHLVPSLVRKRIDVQCVLSTRAGGLNRCNNVLTWWIHRDRRFGSRTWRDSELQRPSIDRDGACWGRPAVLKIVRLPTIAHTIWSVSGTISVNVSRNALNTVKLDLADRASEVVARELRITASHEPDIAVENAAAWVFIGDERRHKPILRSKRTKSSGRSHELNCGAGYKRKA